MSYLNRLGNFILATATLVGTIIGVGMFGLPYVATKSGLGVTLAYLFILGCVVALVHLVYGEIVLRTQAQHRLIGYAEIYLGKLGKLAATMIFLITLYLALLVYLLVGGEFLKIVFSGWLDFSAVTWAVILGIFGFAVIFKGLRLTGVLEFFMSLALLVLIGGLLIYGAGFIDSKNLSFSIMGNDWFLPYGVILFSLSGGSAIPEIRNFFKGKSAGSFKKAIICGTMIPAIVYAIFIIAVVGISGANTSSEAVNGLKSFLGSSFARYGALVGFLAVITSFFTLGLNLKNSFNLDFKLPHWLSFVLTAAIPMILFFLGWGNFISILSLTGAVMGGLEGILLVAIWSRARIRSNRNPEYSLTLRPFIKYGLAIVFLAGIIYELMYTF